MKKQLLIKLSQKSETEDKIVEIELENITLKDLKDTLKKVVEEAETLYGDGAICEIYHMIDEIHDSSHEKRKPTKNKAN